MLSRRTRTLLMVMLLGLATCRKTPAGRVRVAVTISPIFELARRVAGSDADAFLMVPADQNPEDFHPTAETTRSVDGARLGITVGLGLDAWAEPFLKGQAPDVRILKVGDRVPTLFEPATEAPPSAAGSATGAAIDPYVWLDPDRARLIVKAIAEELARLDAPRARNYRQRATDADLSIDALDHAIEGRVARWKQRGFSTRGVSFAYFGDRYHLVAARDPHGSNSHPATRGIPVVEGLQAFGGTPETETYENLMRFNVAVLENALER